jgi:DNA-binding transcriptional MocR family regulator
MQQDFHHGLPKDSEMANADRPPARDLLDAATLRQIGLSAPTLQRTPPVYQHIFRALERAVSNGAVQPGSRLPAERQLAIALKVSRATVVKAYRELEARGLARGYVGRGTFVSAAPDSSGAPFAWRGKVAAAALRTTDTVIRDLVRNASDPALISAGGGVPALEKFPGDAFRRSFDRVLRRDGHRVWGHGATEGLPALREAVAGRYGGRPENVLILAGAQQGLDLLSRCLVDPGDIVVIDRPGYLGAIHTFLAAGARLVGWDVVRHDLDELGDLLVRYRPKLIYTNPTFQNPTGWTMPIRLRRDFLALAGRLRVPIIEDDTYRELSFGAELPPTLHSLDTQSVVIHLSSFSKVLAPGLRLGWLSAAEPIVEQLALIKQRADPHAPNLTQSIVADLIDDGTFDKHLIELRLEHRRRRDALAAALGRHGASGHLQWTQPDGGLYLWCRLPPRVNSATVMARALADSVSVVHGQPFYADHAGDRELRLCFSGVPIGRADDLARRLLRAIAAVRRETGTSPPLMAIV